MRFLILLIPVLSLVASWSSCKRGPTSPGAGVISVAQMNDFAIRSDLVIPSSATALYYKEYRGMDDQIDLTLEMPAADLGPFLRASGLEADITNTTRGGNLSAVFGHFVPKIPKKFREGQKELLGGDWLNVLVDEDSPTTVLVHLTWFEV